VDGWYLGGVFALVGILLALVAGCSRLEKGP
jgi:hypothetical protein